jgi:hypothetical protein
VKIFTGSIALGERIENGRCCRTLRNSRIGLAKGYLPLAEEPVYVGQFLWEDKFYPATHTPLISRDLFDQVTSAFKRQPVPVPDAEFA